MHTYVHSGLTGCSGCARVRVFVAVEPGACMAVGWLGVRQHSFEELMGAAVFVSCCTGISPMCTLNKNNSQVFRELLVLLELLSPSRYRGGGEVREDDAGGQAGDMQVVEDTDTPGEAAPAAAASQETADTQQASAHHSPQAAAAATGSGSMPGLLGLEGAVDPAATFAADEQAAAAAAEVGGRLSVCLSGR